MFDWNALCQMPHMSQMPFGPYAATAFGSEDSAATDATTAGQLGSFPSPFPGFAGMQGAPLPAASLMQLVLYPQMQMMLFAQQMAGMQLQMVQQLAGQMQQACAQASGADQTKAQASAGMQLPFNLSVADLQKLLQIDASPKTLSMLQKVLDLVFDAYEKQS